MKAHRNIFSYSGDWTPEKKANYFKKYMVLKKRLKEWHSRKREFKAFFSHNTDRITLDGDIWEGLQEELIQEPVYKGTLYKRYW